MTILKKAAHILFLFFALLFLFKAQAQYKIEGDEIVFMFDARDYKRFSKDNSFFTYKLKEIDLENVSIAGEFNGWSKDNWKMKRIGEYTFELRKKIADFNDAFSWRFKYIINGKYWAEPESDFENITKSDQSMWFKKIYDYNLYTAKPDPNGNAHFYLRGYENAKKVILAGTFNSWNEQAFKMKRVKDGWKLSLLLKPDTYEYKFIVDGNWMEDPDNPNKVYNEHHTFNSVLSLNKEITFKLKGYQDANKVILAGSFNNWDKNTCEMIKKEDHWYYALKLSGGKHHYKFIVDNEWIIDPANPIKEYDGYGNINSVKMVE